jgi:DNA-binding Lrp family transcriptional regulator
MAVWRELEPTEGKVANASPGIDELDGRILRLFSTEPRIGVLEASRRLGVARGTVQARLDRLERDGVVTSWAPRISPAALGYGVTAFVTLEIVQHHGRDQVSARLAKIPEVLECWTVTGSGDLWCRIVAHSNADLQRVIDAMVTDAGVVRSVSLIGLAEPIPYRTEPLVQQSVRR